MILYLNNGNKVSSLKLLKKNDDVLSCQKPEGKAVLSPEGFTVLLGPEDLGTWAEAYAGRKPEKKALTSCRCHPRLLHC